MATGVRTPLNLAALASAPSSPVAGQVYYDTTLGQFGVWNGSVWVYLPQAAAVEATYTLRIFAV
jgi:hypothetical protein